MDKDKERTESNSNAIQEFLKEFSRSLRELIANYWTEEVRTNIAILNELLFQSFEAIRKFDCDGATKFWVTFAENLACKGWTLPGLLDREVASSLLEASTKEVDQFFIDFYDVEENYNRLMENILNHELFGEWHELLIQFVENFERGNHLIIIPSIFSVLEGISQKLIFPKYKVYQKPNVRKSLPNQFGIVRGDPNKGGLNVGLIFYASVHFFLVQVFQKGGFDQGKVERPHLINRNWVLHGRDNPSEWQKVDALRLLNALSTLAFLDFLLEDKVGETVAR